MRYFLNVSGADIYEARDRDALAIVLGEEIESLTLRDFPEMSSETREAHALGTSRRLLQLAEAHGRSHFEPLTVDEGLQIVACRPALWARA